MLQRCTNPNNAEYKRYGGRGITVCERWRDFGNFYADMGPRPSPEHSLDRIDNDRGYEPGNVRWATRDQQNRNKRSNRRLTFWGIALTLVDWSKRVGISETTLSSRLRKGWLPEDALTIQPKMGRHW